MPNIRDGARCRSDVNDLMQRWRNYEPIGWSDGADWAIQWQRIPVHNGLWSLEWRR